jgi:hypothetical protein
MKSQTIEMIPAGSILTTTGQGSSKPVAAATMAVMGVDLTAFSGASATITIWLEGSASGLWYPVPFDWRTKSSAAAADVASGTAGNRNAVNVETAVSRWAAYYKHLPWEAVRLSYVLSGTTPNVTIGAWLALK